jgi:hypothetical protein
MDCVGLTYQAFSCTKHSSVRRSVGRSTTNCLLAIAMGAQARARLMLERTHVGCDAAISFDSQPLESLRPPKAVGREDVDPRRVYLMMAANQQGPHEGARYEGAQRSRICPERQSRHACDAAASNPQTHRPTHPHAHTPTRPHTHTPPSLPPGNMPAAARAWLALR